MPIRLHHRQLAYGLALSLPVLALGLTTGLALLMQRDPEPVCAMITPEPALPGLVTLDGPPPPHPACIRVELSAAR